MLSILRRARSSQFDTANPAAKAIIVFDKTIGTKISLPKAFRLLAAVTKAAEYGAWSAVDLRDNKFAQARDLKGRSASFAENSEVEARNIVEEFGLNQSFEEFRDLLRN